MTEISPLRVCLARLLELADQRAAIDPNPKRRKRHKKLARYLVHRIARLIVLESRHE